MAGSFARDEQRRVALQVNELCSDCAFMLKFQYKDNNFILLALKS